MKFSLWTQYGALNSKPIFDSFRVGCHSLGHVCSDNDPNSDIDVIWSVLWNGRMAPNKAIWDNNKSINKPTVVLEVGAIKRGTTWRVGLNGVNREGYLGPTGNNDTRAKLLGLNLKPWKYNDGPIILCSQHPRSQQWEKMPNVRNWVIEIIDEIRNYTNKTIIIRPHPRSPLPNIEVEFKNVIRDEPQKISGTYDDYNFNTNNAWAVINWSSNPAIDAVINGIPVFVGPSSRAWDVANHSLKTINEPLRPDRQQWLNDLAHTEYTKEEISLGIPIKNLTSQL